MLKNRITPEAFYYGLSPGDIKILRFIRERPAKMMDIVAGTGLHLQTVFKFLNQMRESDIVNRTTDKFWFITKLEVLEFL